MADIQPAPGRWFRHDWDFVGTEALLALWGRPGGGYEFLSRRLQDTTESETDHPEDSEITTKDEGEVTGPERTS